MDQLATLIEGWDFIEDRAGTYLSNTASADVFNKTGFRYDFLIYCFIPILVGYFYILKTDIKDNIYITFLKTYTLANAFWILVNQVPFSNRFAYLSWFLMPIIIFYPIIFYPINPKYRGLTIAVTFIGYFGITYYLI